MAGPLKLRSSAWTEGAAIPPRYAFGRIGDDGPFAFSDNISPPLAWSGVPAGTRSFVLICHDPDVPSVGDDVNQAGKTVAADLPRVDFSHWVLVDLPASVTALEEGAHGRGVLPRGKAPGPAPQGRQGVNDYTAWFAGNADMSGVYAGYDGPAPPWNDALLHRYIFTLYAVDRGALELPSPFNRADVLAALKGRILAQASLMGTYTLNPALG